MQGKVVWIDPNNSESIKVQFDSERIAIIELLGTEVDREDILVGKLTNLGSDLI